MTDQKTRIQYIDMARGMAIHMIVMSHVLRRGVLTDYLATCGITVFIILSGAVSKTGRHTEGAAKRDIEQNYGLTGKVDEGGVRQKSRSGSIMAGWPGYILKRLYIPYLTAGIISILIYRLMGSFAAEQIGISLKETSLQDNLLALVYANAKDGSMKWNESLWYIPCHIAVLCLARLAGRLDSRQGRKNPGLRSNDPIAAGRFILSLLLIPLPMLTGRFLSWHLKLRLPFQTETAVLLLAFYEYGRVLADTPLLRQDTPVGKRHLAASGLLIGMGLLWSGHCGQISIRMDQYPKFAPAMLMMLCSGPGWILAARAFMAPVGSLHSGISVQGISTCRSLRSCMHQLRELFLRYMTLCGRQSLWILMWNKFPVLLFQTVPPLLLGKSVQSLYMENDSAEGLLVSVPIAVICILLCLLWQHICHSAARR